MQAPGKLPPVVGAQCGRCTGSVRTASRGHGVLCSHCVLRPLPWQYPVLWDIQGRARIRGLRSPPSLFCHRARTASNSEFPARRNPSHPAVLSTRDYLVATALLEAHCKLLAARAGAGPAKLNDMIDCPRPGSSAEQTVLVMGRGQTCS